MITDFEVNVMDPQASDEADQIYSIHIKCDK